MSKTKTSQVKEPVTMEDIKNRAKNIALTLRLVNNQLNEIQDFVSSYFEDEEGMRKKLWGMLDNVNCRITEHAITMSEVYGIIKGRIFEEYIFTKKEENEDRSKSGN